MGLFTLLACSEDSYQEADKMNGTTENSSANNIKPMTSSPGYNSPYKPFAMLPLNYGTRTVYRNTSPLQLRLYPYAGMLHQQSHFAYMYPNFPNYATFPGLPFDVAGGMTIISSTCDGVFPVVNFNTCTTSSLAHDFGSPGLNGVLLHYAKIQFYKYEILDTSGSLITSGYIKQKFMNDTDTDAVIGASGEWQTLGDVDNLPPGTVAMYNTKQDEICITRNSTSVTPLLSTIGGIVDPATGTAYKLTFDTDSNEVKVTLGL